MFILFVDTISYPRLAHLRQKNSSPIARPEKNQATALPHATWKANQVQTLVTPEIDY